jgi:hypothetical protein
VEKPVTEFRKRKEGSLDGYRGLCKQCMLPKHEVDPNIKEKFCPKCQTPKDIQNFDKNRNVKDGLDRWCKKCSTNYKAEWRQKNPGKYKVYAHKHWVKNKDKKNAVHTKWVKEHQEHLKEYGLQRKFGISLDDYNKISENQGGVCAICSSAHSKTKRSGLHLDHNHETGTVRGLLCFHCNTGLGHFKDNIEFLKSAILYIVKSSKSDRDIFGRSAMSTISYRQQIQFRRVLRLGKEEYEKVLLMQNGKCGICKSVLENGIDSHLDHDHVTGKVRGFLCHNCNLGVGKLGDSPESLSRAIEYLEKHTTPPNTVDPTTPQVPPQDPPPLEHC